MKNVILISLKSIGLFLTLVLFMLFIHLTLMGIALVIFRDPSSIEQIFLERFYPLTAATIIIFWTRKKRKKIFNKIRDALKFNKGNIRYFLKYTALSLVVFISLFCIAGFFGYQRFIHFGTMQYSELDILKRYILIGFAGNFFVAIGEEIIFRGFLQNSLIELSKSKWFGLLFTSFVFALHLYPDFLNNVIAFFGGLAMGFAYLKLKTLYIPIAIHMSYNIFNGLIASESSRGPQIPYLIKFEYPMIVEGFGAWIDLFILLGFIVILVYLVLIKVPHPTKKMSMSLSVRGAETV